VTTSGGAKSLFIDVAQGDDRFRTDAGEITLTSTANTNHSDVEPLIRSKNAGRDDTGNGDRGSGFERRTASNR
jgi:hypothetical protein